MPMPRQQDKLAQSLQANKDFYRPVSVTRWIITARI